MAVGRLFVIFLLSYVTFVFMKILIFAITHQREDGPEIPSPRFARFTRIWMVKILATGNSAKILADISRKYGSVVRVGPKHILTSDPTTIRRILAKGSGYVRASWFDTLKLDPHSTNIVSERDPQRHHLLRYKLAPAYAGKGLNGLEGVVEEQVGKWVDYINRFGVSRPNESRHFDIAASVKHLTIDVISKLALGEAFGYIDNNKDMHGLLHAVQSGMRATLQISVFPELQHLLYYITKFPLFHKLLIPSPGDTSGIGVTLSIVEKFIDERTRSGVKQDKDMLGIFMDKGLSRQQTREEVVIALIGGSETTSTAIHGTLLAIISNSQVYGKLMREILRAEAEGSVSSPIKDKEARQLLYFQACIYEGLRWFTPIGQLRDRLVPPEGDTILGYKIPGGTHVGLNPWGTQLSKVYGDDPEVFRPERWLINDEERLQRMHQCHELIFGCGPTKCLGVNIAMMEINKALFELLRNFDISIINPAEPWKSECWGIFFQRDFYVRISRRDLQDFS